MKLYDFVFNRLYPRLFFFLYKLKFSQIGKKSRVRFPRRIIDPKCLHMGDNSTVMENARIQSYPTKQNAMPKIKIGNNVGIQYDFSAIAGDDIIIEDNCLLASGVALISENHGMDPTLDGSYVTQELQSSKIIIKKGAWIGEKVCILPGVTVGTKSIIGALSVVTKSVPDYSIAVGNPAKVIKKYNFEKKSWEKI